MFERFKIIQRFKDYYPSNLESVNFARVIAVYLYETTTKAIAKRIIFSLFFATKHEILGDIESPWILVYSVKDKKRTDYDDTFHKITKLFPEKYCTLVTTNKPSPLFFLKLLPHLLSAYRETDSTLFTRLDRISIVLLIAKLKYEYHNAVNLKILDRKQGLLTFCDAMPIDNLLTQIAKKRHIKTITNQHGQCRVLSNSNMSQDAEMYANFISDRIFCWGNATKYEFLKAGFKHEQLVITGRFSSIDTVNKRESTSANSFGVLFNGENSKDANFTLIKVASKLAESTGRTFYIRMHPANIPEEYKCETLEHCVGIGFFDDNEYLDLVQFSLGHMTGAIVDLLRNEHRVYLYDDGKLADVFKVKDLHFTSVNEIIEDIQNSNSTTNRSKAREIYRWFNDDSRQYEAICAEITTK